MRAYNSLKRNNIVKVGQLLQLSDDDLLRMRNFGKKSLDEMKERLRMRGFIVPETEGDELGEAEETVRRRDRGGLTDGPPDRRPQAQPQAGSAARAVQEPDRVGAALRADQDHRGQGQGGPRPRRAHDHAGQAGRPHGPSGGRSRRSRTSRSSSTSSSTSSRPSTPTGRPATPGSSASASGSAMPPRSCNSSSSSSKRRREAPPRVRYRAQGRIRRHGLCRVPGASLAPGRSRGNSKPRSPG